MMAHPLAVDSVQQKEVDDCGVPETRRSANRRNAPQSGIDLQSRKCQRIKISPADDQAGAEIDSEILADGGVRFDSGESAETSFRTSE